MKTLNIILLLVIPSWGYSQQELCFHYDKAGNQRLITTCGSGEEQLSDEEIFKDTLDEKRREEHNVEKITLDVAPNPVIDELTVYWQHKEQKPMTELFITSVDGKILYKRSTLQATQHKVNIADYPTGFYLLVLEFADGSRKIFKVVKR
ncbi:T9SS type A sorting domain-containing protein [Capnocytophaga periodontitidis]|uniref:T9SS type A sorting domain-containing protein n=1 Tax=Capnocytophaga periodontitidis TaxID=2795027 RepID=UPI0018E1A642|nr:T9SS type A sorting domain-containing protein [Capnocytophaga periodontitidis]MBI1668672.1 T9SS type A sorting domain-containing protein [Capnocytophaga periodontitidis]